MPTYTSFKSSNDIGRSQFTNILALNLQAWLDWAFLGIGSFYNVSLQYGSGVYGGNNSQLRPVSEPYYAPYQVFEAYRSNWVFESGIEYAIQPTQISGVYINNTFYPVGNTTCPFSISYPLGRIIFNSGLPTTTIINCEYPFKWINISTNEAPWTRHLMQNSLRVDNPQFLQQGSGIWDILSINRVQLPAIIIEPIANVTMHGYELGGGLLRHQDVIFHVFSESPWMRNNLTDILIDQMDKQFYIYDVNAVSDSGVFPLDFSGFLNASGWMYPSLVSDSSPFRTNKLTVLDTSSINVEDARGLYRSAIRWTTEMVISHI